MLFATAHRGLPSGNLTWLLKMAHLKLIYPLKMVIFHSYVNLPEGNSDKLETPLWKVPTSSSAGRPFCTDILSAEASSRHHICQKGMGHPFTAGKRDIIIVNPDFGGSKVLKKLREKPPHWWVLLEMFPRQTPTYLFLEMMGL